MSSHTTRRNDDFLSFLFFLLLSVRHLMLIVAVGIASADGGLAALDRIVRVQDTDASALSQVEVVT